MAKKKVTKKKPVLKQPFKNMCGFVLWDSNKIPYAYYRDNYSEECGTLGKSCMRTKDMQKALNFYVKNNVKILVMVTPSNKIKCRALYWDNLTYCDKKIIYVDRLYYSRESQLKDYYKFVTTNNLYAYHASPEYERRNNVTLNNIPYDKVQMGVNLGGITHLPYADTMRWLDYEEKILYNKETRSSYLIQLSSLTDYGYHRELDPDAIQEVFTRQWCSKKDCIYIKKYNGYVQKNHIVEINKVYYSQHDSCLTFLSNDTYCLTEDAVLEVFTNKLIDRNKAIYAEKYSGYVSNENHVKLHNDDYSIEDSNVVKVEDTPYLIHECYPLYSTTNNSATPIYIPKIDAMIIYTKSSDEGDRVEFNKELYVKPSFTKIIKMCDGSYILDTTENRKHLKKWNKIYHYKDSFQIDDKNQLLLFK